MPIRINLLAEAHELEELRRRDPVKRAIYIACAIVGAVLVYAASVEAGIMAEGGRLRDLETRIKTTTSEYEAVSVESKKLREIQSRLASLTQLSTNRLLLGNVLNALQFTTVEGIELTSLRVNQAYETTEETKSITNETGRVIAGKPASAIERVNVILDGRDGSARGEQVDKLRDALAGSGYFRDLLGNTAEAKANEFKLTNLSPPQTSPGATKPYSSFTIEGRLPERAR